MSPRSRAGLGRAAVTTVDDGPRPAGPLTVALTALGVASLVDEVTGAVAGPNNAAATAGLIGLACAAGGGYDFTFDVVGACASIALAYRLVLDPGCLGAPAPLLCLLVTGCFVAGAVAGHLFGTRRGLSLLAWFGALDAIGFLLSPGGLALTGGSGLTRLAVTPVIAAGLGGLAGFHPRLAVPVLTVVTTLAELGLSGATGVCLVHTSGQLGAALVFAVVYYSARAVPALFRR